MTRPPSVLPLLSPEGKRLLDDFARGDSSGLRALLTEVAALTEAQVRSENLDAEWAALNGDPR